MALKKGINVRHGRQYGDRGATSASELAYDANTTTKQKIDALATAVASKADLTDLAPAFSTETAYAVGQYVSYGGNIYKCTSAHSAGEWAAGDFTLVAVGSELESKQNATDNNLQTTDKTVVGAVNELKSGLEKNALVSMVDISSYSDATPYTTTSDGYLYLNNGSGQTARVLIGSAGYASVGGNQGRYSVFVRKGTQLLPSGTADAIRFVPLS